MPEPNTGRRKQRARRQTSSAKLNADHLRAVAIAETAHLRQSAPTIPASIEDALALQAAREKLRVEAEEAGEKLREDEENRRREELYRWASRPPAHHDAAAVAQKLAAEEQAERERRRRALLEASGLLAQCPHYATAELDNFSALQSLGMPDADLRRYASVARRFARAVDLMPLTRPRPGIDTGTILLSIGQGGEGKTQILAGAVVRACNRLLGARFLTLRSWIKQLNDAKKFSVRRTEEEVHELMVRPAVLGIDEIDKAVNGQDEIREALAHVIDARHAAGKLTMMTANLVDMAGVEHALGPRVVARMQEPGIAGPGEVISCRWPDLRQLRRQAAC